MRILQLSGLILVACCLAACGRNSREPAGSGLVLKTIVSENAPKRVLSLSKARDALFRDVAPSDNDSVYCIYTGIAIVLEPGEDPSKSAWRLDFNTEHVYPQSKGARSGWANSDLHHLFPTVGWANGARDNAPYAEIPAQTVDRWLCKHGRAEVPHPGPDSEFSLARRGSDEAFEPMDSRKGDVARAVFYFYAMYREEADGADPRFFDRQKDILLDWHRTDPPDDREFARNLRVEAIQGNVNPFIVDTSLVWAAFFAEQDVNSEATEKSSENANAKPVDQLEAVELWICELHYDNKGTDVNEGFGVCGEVGTRLDGWTVVLYNGKTGKPYGRPTQLTGFLQDAGRGPVPGGGGNAVDTGKAWFDAPGLQNGPRDGLALVRPDGSVVEFLSYEGVMMASGGPAAGMMSFDILVSESSKGWASSLLRKSSATGAWLVAGGRPPLTDSVFANLNSRL